MPRVKLYRYLLNGQVATIGVAFVDTNGKKVTLSFDPRAEKEENIAGMEIEKYSVYVDSPVFTDGDKSHIAGGSATALQRLRDALNEMDLGF